MKELELLKIADNTILIFSSDNGPVLNDGYLDGAVTQLNGHTPWGPFRGGKYSAYEAGTRIPFIIRWPGKIATAQSDAMICQMDLLASFAGFLKQKLPKDEAIDSKDLMPVLMGKTKIGRDVLVEQGLPALAIVKGDWKYIEPNDGKRMDTLTNIELANSPQPQLYNLKEDKGEKYDLAKKYPSIVKEMADLLLSIKNKN